MLTHVDAWEDWGTMENYKLGIFGEQEVEKENPTKSRKTALAKSSPASSETKLILGRPS